MNISDFQHTENRKAADVLRTRGFEFEVNANGYSVSLNGRGLGGASVRLPRSEPLHYRHRDANLRDNLASAISLARRHLSVSA